MFGLSDTDGDELPAVEVPGWDADAALAGLGIDRVPFADLDGNKQGYSYEDEQGRYLAINPTAAYPVKTLAHELAHLVLGHCKADDHTHRGVEEFEAEGFAYLVCKELELISWDSAESRIYIQTLLGGTEATEEHIQRIFAAADPSKPL